MNDYGIDLEACRSRQARLLDATQDFQLDLIIVTQVEHVQWLTGPRFGWAFEPTAALTKDGQVTLVAPQTAPEIAAADDVRTYEAKWHSTMRNDQRAESSRVLLDALSDKLPCKRIGVEFSAFPQHLAKPLNAEFVDIEPTLYQLRRRKDPDELSLIRKAISGTAKMYEQARSMIQPGVSEIAVFNALQAVAVEEFGEMLTGTGNDYQCCSRGGPPRNQYFAKAGDLYILDLGPAFRGYFADNARTIAVSEPADEQQEAWHQIMKVFKHVERTVRPGKNAKELFDEAQAILDEAPIGVFDHHLGHGIGLFPHEAPHLNPNWNDTFEVGDVFTAEPGLYAPELCAGMRIENDYLVTNDGVELLTEFPLELK